VGNHTEQPSYHRFPNPALKLLPLREDHSNRWHAHNISISTLPNNVEVAFPLLISIKSLSLFQCRDEVGDIRDFCPAE